MSDMRKCRNWQTSKTKDLVSNALVWVQVPSSAFVKSMGNLDITKVSYFFIVRIIGYRWLLFFLNIKNRCKCICMCRNWLYRMDIASLSC